MSKNSGMEGDSAKRAEAGMAAEAAEFYVKAAKNSELSMQQRRQHVYDLFRWHVRPGMTLSDLARLVGGATWWREEDIVRVYMGYKGVAVTFGYGTVFALRMFPELRNEMGAIYLRLSPDLEENVREDEVFRILIGGTARPTVMNAQIFEMGWYEPDRYYESFHKFHKGSGSRFGPKTNNPA